MQKIDISESFIYLVIKEDQRRPELRLTKDLAKVNSVLRGYAKSLNIAFENVSLLQVCASGSELNRGLIRYVESENWERRYKGEIFSRIKKLVKNLPWGGEDNLNGSDQRGAFEAELPEHLRQVWFLLPRVRHPHPGGRLTGARREAYDLHRTSLPLLEQSTEIGLILIKVSKAYNITDIRVLLEDFAGEIYDAIKMGNSSRNWSSLMSDFDYFRQKVRKHVGYKLEKKEAVSLEFEELPEPLRSQVETYMERALYGFKTDKKIKKLALRKYNLELEIRAPITVQKYVYILRLGLGHVPREMYGETLDIRDLLRLDLREYEVDDMLVKELYNPIVEYYRERELNRSSSIKKVNYDSRAFSMFIRVIAAVAAYNGLLHPRELFLKEYQANTDNEGRRARRQHKKQTFNREWVSKQMEGLKVRFNRIVKDGSFRRRPDGTLSRDAKDNLNLCLFYVCVLVLRFLGVRQQCVRNCVIGRNALFGAAKSITFFWSEEEVKNGKGIVHRLNIKKHDLTHADLINGVWAYYKKIYPYVVGGGDMSADKNPGQGVEPQLFLKVRLADGACVPFKDHSDFYTWFIRQARKYFDYRGQVGKRIIEPNPHFYRGEYTDWLRNVLEFSKDKTEKLAGDLWRTLEIFYIDHPSVYDATDDWTKKNQEMREREAREKSRKN